jgi:putative glutamine amidotransferase
VISRRPIIAITTYVADARWGPWDQPVALVPRGYVEAVSRAGGRPVLVPPCTDGVAETLGLADGLIFCGGPDLEPRLYGQPRAAATAQLAPERDVPELQLLSAALEADVPVLGICRGMQLLNVVRSGTLVQHLPDAIGHDGHATAPGHFDLHGVRTEPGTRTAAILGEDEVVVHSGHHQGVGHLGEALAVGARAADGVIEAIEDPGAAFALGVLWHPEQGDDLRLFEALVAAAAGAPVTAAS